MKAVLNFLMLRNKLDQMCSQHWNFAACFPSSMKKSPLCRSFLQPEEMRMGEERELKMGVSKMSGKSRV